MLSKIFAALALGLILLVGLVGLSYLRDMNRAYRRVDGASSRITSLYGDIEYSESGAGPDVLVVHGAGGGFDQGELLAQAVLGKQFHAITPSRFGYLRSTFHAGATFQEQADAFAYLLDSLGIEKVAVVAMSAGGPSAELFAIQYPERVTSLTLLSCATTALPPSKETAQSSQQGDLLAQIVKYDLPYWLVSKVFEKQLMGLMGANETVVAGLTPAQRMLVKDAIDYMDPASRRAGGVGFDNRAPSVPGDQVAQIHVPTLIIHATDDTLQPYYHASFAASTIPGAKLLRFERGGHLVFAVEQATIQAAVQKHILEHLAAPETRKQ